MAGFAEYNLYFRCYDIQAGDEGYQKCLYNMCPCDLILVYKDSLSSHKKSLL